MDRGSKVGLERATLESAFCILMAGMSSFQMQLLIHDYAGHPFPVQLSRELARRGHGVTHAFAGGLLTPRGTLHRKADDPNTFKIVEVPMDANYRRDKYCFIRRRRMEREYGHKVAALIEEERPFAVISGQTPTEPQLTIAKACSRRGIRFIPWIQDFYSVAVSNLAARKLPVIGHLAGTWYRRLEKSALHYATSVVAITEDFVPLLRRFGVPQDKITVIPNWAPLDELPERPRWNEWAAKHDLNDKTVFLYSGTLAMKHNPEILRQLALKFLNRHHEVRIVVISEGPGCHWLDKQKQKEALSNLLLMPFQPFTAMAEVLGAADVLVAILEPDAGVFSVPSKVLSYHCAGRPILGVLPSRNLAARIISENQTGLCITPGDGSGFVSAVEKLYADSGFRSECGRRARHYAEHNFVIEKIADRFEQLALYE
jgi:glycosyltransferase involved in cell wall biosynthesis